jgi:hypothetical protein
MFPPLTFLPLGASIYKEYDISSISCAKSCKADCVSYLNEVYCTPHRFPEPS